MPSLRHPVVRLAVVLTVLGIAWAGCSMAAAAQKGRKPAAKPQSKGGGENVQGKGPIEDMDFATAQIKVRLFVDQNWTLKPAKGKDVKLRVVGTAEFGVVTPGMFVQVTGLLDKKRGTVMKEVPKVTIFTPSPDMLPGAVLDETGTNQFAPADNPNAKFYIIGGQVTAVNNRTMTLNVQNQKVLITAIEQPEVVFDMDFTFAMGHNLGVVKKGDEISIKTAQREGNANVAFVSEATIFHADPWKAADKAGPGTEKKSAPPEKKPEPEKKPDGK